MKALILSIITVFAASTLCAQTDREFWFVAPEVTTTHYDFIRYADFGNKVYRGGEPSFLRISTRGLASTVTIEMPANTANFPPISINVPANSTYSVNLTDLVGQNAIENKYLPGGINNKGIHIKSTELITVYYEVATTNNTDLFALKGKNALGTEFYTPFQTVSRNNTGWTLHEEAKKLGELYPTPATSAIDIVATQDNTEITIRPSKLTFEGRPAGDPYTIILNKGETYTLGPQAYTPTWNPNPTNNPEAANRLAGTKITSNHPIAVTVSDDSMRFPGDGNWCYDLFGDQLVPTSIIGHEYIAIRGRLSMAGRTNGKTGEQLYILATKNNTPIYINGTLVKTLTEGETYFHEFVSTDIAVHIGSNEDKPFYVLHISGFGCEMGGAYLPPTSACTGSTQIGFTRSTSEGFFLNLMVRKNAFDGFLLNGTPILTQLADWTVVPADPNWLVARLDLTSSNLVQRNVQSLIVNTKDIFHMGVINGNQTGGCRYGYFSDYNKLQIDAITTNTQSGTIRICYGESVRLEGYGGTNFHWTPHDFLDNPYSQNPLAHPRGNIKYTVSVSGACEMVGTADVSIQVAPKVEALFEIDTVQACAPYEFVFDNFSTGVTDYSRWDFGDGTPPVNNNSPQIKRIYNNDTDTSQRFMVMLVTKNLESCRDTLRRQIVVFPSISAGFTPSIDESCAPFPVNFANTSLGARGPRPYVWEFGDGAASSDPNPVHNYSNLGRADSLYNVSLVATNQYYCTDTARAVITAHPYIKADYALQPVVACAPYIAEIHDKSIAADTYSWNYGDGAASATNASLHQHQYLNSGASTQTRQLRLAVSNNQGCADTLIRNVVIHPYIESRFTANKTTICDEEEVSFTNTSIGAASYLWEFGDGASSSQASPRHKYRNMSSSSATYTARLIAFASNGFCADTSEIQITVHPFLSAQYDAMPSTGCSPQPVAITNSSVGASGYTWAFGDGQASFNSQPSFTHIYTNNTAAARTYILSLVASNTQGCTKKLERNITVFPPIIARFNMSAPVVCDNTEVSFTSTSQGASAYFWDFGDGSTSSVQNPKHIFRNNTAQSIDYTVKLVIRANNNACYDSVTHTVRVHPKIEALFSIDKPAGCSPHTFKVTDASLQASSYSWALGDGAVYSTAGNIEHTFVNTGSQPRDFIVRLRVENPQGCSMLAEKTVAVYPKVEASFAVTDGCTPHTIGNFANTSANSSTYEWDLGDGTSSNLANPAHTFTNNSPVADKSFTVRLKAISEHGCSDIAEKTVTAYYAPLAQFNILSAAGCSPYKLSISNTSQGAASQVWDFGDGRPAAAFDSADFSVSYENNTRQVATYPIKLTATSNNGCISSISRNAVIHPAVTAEFSTIDGCHPLQVGTFSNTSVGAAQYNWEFGDGVSSNLQHPAHLFANSSHTQELTYKVKLTATSPTGCLAVEEKTVTVFPKPLAQFEIGAATGCSPYSVEILSQSAGASVYSWDMGDGQVLAGAADFSHDYFNSTRDIIYYPVKLSVENTYGCTHQLERNAMVYPDIKAEFEIESGCHPLTVADFKNTTVGAESYFWDFGDASSSSSAAPLHTFNNFSAAAVQQFTVKLTATSINGCISEKDTVITVYNKPIAEFSIGSAAGCSPHFTGFSNLSQGAASLLWEMGDASQYTETGPWLSHTFQNPSAATRVFPVKLTAETVHGCLHSITRNVSVYPDIKAAFAATDGCHPHFISDFASSSTGADYYSWQFGDGQSSNQPSPSHLFSNFSNHDDSIYTVKLKVESEQGCADSAEALVIVHPKPLAEFLIANPEACAPHTINIANQSQGAARAVWNFGSGYADEEINTAELSNLYHNISGATITFPTILIAYSQHGCSDTLQRNSIIHSQVIVQFEAESGCHPHSIADFKNTTIGAGQYNWAFGDGQSSNLQHPAHLFSNISRTQPISYNIRLEARSIYGCSDSKDTLITVYHKPLAEFSVENTPGCSPYPVPLTDKSAGSATNSWDFGDGSDTVASSGSIIHTFRNSTGIVKDYEVRLIALTEHSCADTISRLAKIFPDITADFEIDGGCHPHFIADFKNSSRWADKFQWDFGDGGTSSAQYPSHLFRNFSRTADTAYIIKLATESIYGCRADTSIGITVKYKPQAEFSVLNSPGCSPYTINMEDKSAGAKFKHWNFGDGQERTETSALSLSKLYDHSGPDLRSFPIRLIAETEGGCYDTITRNAIIYPNISSIFHSTPAGCSPMRLYFDNLSEGASVYRWNLGDGNSSLNVEPSHTYYNHSRTKDTVFTISLETESKYGCKAFSETDITVKHNPLAEFTVLNSPICAPDTIKMNNTSLGADYLMWDFGDGSTRTDTATGATGKHFTHRDSDLRNYRIRLVAQTDFGCLDTAFRNAIVYPEVDSDFSFQLSGCNPLKIETNNKSLGASQYRWNLGDGNSSSQKDLKHTYLNFNHLKDSSFVVSLSTESKYGCKAFSQQTVTVYPVPFPDFSMPKDLDCSPFNIPFANKSKGGHSYKWNFGDGSAIDSRVSPSHTFTNKTNAQITRTVKLEVSNNRGCIDSVSKTITVNPEVTADFAGVFEGCHPHRVDFANRSKLGDTYSWDLGENGTQTGASPISIFENLGTVPKEHTVKLRAVSRYGCYDTISKIITVYPAPVAAFQAQPMKQVFPSSDIGKATVNITDKTSEGNWDYEWDFGDGSQSAQAGSLSHVYAKWNQSGETYPIKLRVSNQWGCADQAVVEVIVTSPKPEPWFNISSDNGCPPYEVSFTDKSAYANKVRWYFGDGLEATERNPKHTYHTTGTYRVVFEIEGDGGISAADTIIEIHQMPIANFDIENPLLMLPKDSLKLLNLSAFGNRYLWDFGDGSQSAQKQPIHYYTEKGVYDINLQVWTVHECTRSISKPNAVTVYAPCAIDFPNAFTPSTTASNGGRYKGLEATNDIFFPAVLEEGITKFHLEVYNKWGEMIFVSHDKEIGWDGYYRGQLSKLDVYVWKLKAVCADGREIVKVGDVTLLR
jgi:PKD repeat protein